MLVAYNKTKTICLEIIQTKSVILLLGSVSYFNNLKFLVTILQRWGCNIYFICKFY